MPCEHKWAKPISYWPDAEVYPRRTSSWRVAFEGRYHCTSADGQWGRQARPVRAGFFGFSVWAQMAVAVSAWSLLATNKAAKYGPRRQRSSLMALCDCTIPLLATRGVDHYLLHIQQFFFPGGIGKYPT